MRTTEVSYRRDDANEDGEGWPCARSAPFNFHADYGPIGVGVDELLVDDVALWAAGAEPLGAVSVALAATLDDGSEATAVAYMDPDAARAFAAQLLTAADAVDEGESFDPNLDRSAERYSPSETSQKGGFREANHGRGR